MTDYALVIDGQRVTTVDMFPVVNPADESPADESIVGHAPQACMEHLDQAVAFPRPMNNAPDSRSKVKVAARARSLDAIRGILAALLLGFGFTASSAEAVTAKCNRTCLRALMDQYLSAVFQHDPSRAGLAEGAKTTVNNVEIKDGEGVWRTVTGYGRVRRVYADPATGGAVFFGHLAEGAAEGVASVRIKVSARKITQVEWAIARKSEADVFDADGLVRDTPPAQRYRAPRAEKRSEMLVAANAFYQGLKRYNGSQVPHVDGCERVENGFRLTHRLMIPPAVFLAQMAAKERGETPPEAKGEMNGDCVSDLHKMRSMVGSFEAPRFLLMDEEEGVVMAATIIQSPPSAPQQQRLLLTDFFYVKRGKLAGIWNVVVFRLGSNSAWANN